MREFYGLIVAEGITGGIFMTTGSFPRDAVEFAQAKPIQLLDRAKVEEMIKSSARPGRIYMTLQVGLTTSPPQRESLIPVVAREIAGRRCSFRALKTTTRTTILGLHEVCKTPLQRHSGGACRISKRSLLPRSIEELHRLIRRQPELTQSGILPRFSTDPANQFFRRLRLRALWKSA